MRYFFLTLLCLIALLVFDFCKSNRHVCERNAPSAKIDTVVIHDTLHIAKPISVESAVVRIDTIRVKDANDTIYISAPIPITQMRYTDSTYTAWVSGYAPRLDSIHLRPVRTVVTIRPEAKKPRRWQFGLHGGVGITPKGVQPYIGIGVSYNILSF